ncbi:MAG: CPBP family intramembrane metalloprotease [Anaerolineae bacterium]|nr:CPBP family intramembrane metalloprotease [Anaerolineae bacterium]
MAQRIDRLLLIVFLAVGTLCASYVGWRDVAANVRAGTSSLNPLIGLGEGPARLLFITISAFIIARGVGRREEPAPAVRRPWPELAIIGVYLLWLGLIFTAQVRRLDFSRFAPGYSWLAAFLRDGVAEPLTTRLGWEGWAAARLNNLTQNVVTQLLIPLLIFLALGYGARALGFRLRGWWLALPLAIPTMLLQLAGGSFALNPARFPAAFLFNLGISGLPEEFWARSLLQTRLEHGLGSALRGAVIAAIVFGLMHLPAHVRNYGSDWPRVIAACLGRQALSGFVFGYLWLKTRSLAPGALWHAFGNTIGSG